MKKLIEYFVKYPIWANAIIFTMVVFGAVSYGWVMKRSFFPETDPTTITVGVVMPGASPEEMEEGVTIKIEESLKGIEGVKEITSTSSENSANIVVQLERGIDADEALAEVKNAVDRINSFPTNAERPLVFKVKPRSRTMYLGLRAKDGKNVDLFLLKKYAEQIEDEMLASGTISQINISGYPDIEISIEVPEATLLRYNLRFEQIATAVRQNNRDISAGSIKSKEEEILIRSRAKEKIAEKIGSIVLRANADGSNLRLRDIATIKEQFADVPNGLKINGEQAVSLEITKLKEEDLEKISVFANEYVKTFNSKHADVELVVSFDFFDLLSQRLQMLIDNGIMGLVLVLICLGLFLSLRLSFWVAMGIPISFAGMFVIAALMGITINMISLFGMILVVGILVDDGIVIGENIFTHFEMGKSPMRATVDGAYEVLPSVFTSVLTTIVAFMPIAIGIEGFDFLQEMGLIVVICLAVSLIEAFFVLPSHLTHKDMGNAQKEGKFRATLNKGIDFLRHKIYGTALKHVLRFRYIYIFVPVVFVMIILGMVNGQLIKVVFFPNIPFDSFDASIAFKAGTPKEKVLSYLERFDKATWEVNDELKKEFNDEKNFINYTFQNLGRTSDGSENGSHAGHVSISLLDMDDREVTSNEISDRVRKKIGDIPEAELFTVSGRNRFGKPVSIRLLSKNNQALDQATEQLKKELENYAGLKEITDNQRVGRRELQLDLKPKAYFLGLTHADITNQIRQGFFGEEIQRLQKGTDEVRVWVRYPAESRETLGQLETMRIKTADGKEIPLSEVASYTIDRGIVDIKHFDGSREIAVEAELDDPNGSPVEIIEKLQATTLLDLKSKFPSLTIDFGGQQQRSQESQKSLQFALPIMLFIIILLITLTFRSLSQSILVMLLIPLGLFCAVFGHYFADKPVSLLSLWGILALSGVIINDAVVLVSKFNSNLQEGMTMPDAVYNAGISRFRAIILTSITTVAGLAPLIMETSFQAQFLIPMAISVAYGVGFGTFLILLIFPVILLVVNDMRRMIVYTKRWVAYKWKGYEENVPYPNSEEVEPANREIVRLKIMKEME